LIGDAASEASMPAGADLAAATGATAAPDAQPSNRTLAIIKLDAVAAGKADEILHLAELCGFTIIQQQRVQVRTDMMLYMFDHRLCSPLLTAPA